MSLRDFLPSHPIPQFFLSVRPNPKAQGNAQDITQLISPRLMSLTLTDSRGFEADQLDLTLDDADGKLALPSRGAILHLALGFKGAPLIEKGEYTVDELEHSGAPDVVNIRARSADLRGSLMERQARSFHDSTLGKIVAQLASENQLTPKVSKRLENVKISHIDQTDESAINFLTRLAETYDAIATVKNGNLLFMEAGKGESANGKPLPPQIITRQKGDQHRFAIAEGNNYKAVKAHWHNPNNGKRGEVYFDGNTQVEKKRKQKKTGKKTGGGLSKNTHIALNQTAPIITDSDNIKTLRHTYASEQTARTAAMREFGRLQRGVATFSLNLALGNPELMPETPVIVQGFKPEIDSNQWIITQVTHTLSAEGGLVSAVEMELKGEDSEG